jgi:hypothetical protein
MMDRRKLLIGTGAAATYAFSASILPSRDAAASGRPELVSENEETEQLLYELARLEARYYTEEGVAMVLACENLAVPPGDASAASFGPGNLNERFSCAYRHYVNQLNELRRDLGEHDAVAVLEYLAWRDFEGQGSAGS